MLTSGTTYLSNLAPESSTPGSPTISPKAGRQNTPSVKRPHVLFVIDRLLGMGGAERMLFEIVRRLAADRFEWRVVTFQIDAHFEELKEFACPLDVFPLSRTYDLNAWKVALKLRRLIRDHEITIVHTFFETSDLWAAPIALLSGCRVLVSSRRDMGVFRTRKHQIAYSLISRFCDRIITVSDQVRGYCMRQDHVRPEKVETLYNGIDLEELSVKASRYDARLELSLPQNVPIISTLANIRAVKGIDTLVRAADIVRREFPNSIFLIVGESLEDETYCELQRLVASLRLEETVRFIGRLTNPYPVLQVSDVFCLPSRSEGFSNALLEAMGSGLACVATQVGGNGEAIESGMNGYLVKSDDAEAMADRILQLLRDSQLRRRLGDAARQTVRARFAIQAKVDRLMDLYDQLVAGKHA